MNKAYLDTEISNIKGHISLIEKDYNEFKLCNDKDAKHPLGLEKPNKQSEEVSIERAVKTEVNERRRTDVEEVNDDNVIQ